MKQIGIYEQLMNAIKTPSKRDAVGVYAEFYLDDLMEIIDKTGGEVLEEVKKKLPTHKGKMISRTEIKKLLNELKKI
jgi:hypothetical protein